MYYAKAARKAGIVTSLDGGGLRSNTHELLSFIEVAIVSERLCEQMAFEPTGMLEYLKSRGCRIGGVTLGHRGLIWYDEAGTVQTLPAVVVPEDRVIDTSGAGDVFHGASIPISPMRQNLGRSTSILLVLPPPTRSSISVTKQVYQLLRTSPQFKLASKPVAPALNGDADSFLALPCLPFFSFSIERPLRHKKNGPSGDQPLRPLDPRGQEPTADPQLGGKQEVPRYSPSVPIA